MARLIFPSEIGSSSSIDALVQMIHSIEVLIMNQVLVELSIIDS